MASTASPVLYRELDVKLPIVMLPVRLETRYFEVNSDLVELRVRIFPSPVHVTSARPGIDIPERDETIGYWRTRKTTGDTSPATDAAWQRLVQLFGDARAQYLRRILTPTTDASGGLVFPSVPLNPPPDDSTLLTGEATALPSRFFVAGYLAGGSRQFLVPGQKVPATVTAGPQGDPAAIRWQSDFTAAEAIGLGIRVQVPVATARYLKNLLVFGVREGTDAATSQSALQTLLERHGREHGVALLPAGTPTNNTAASRITAPTPARGVTPGRATDPGRLTLALGLDTNTFANASGTTASTDALVEAMHTALWPATLGYFLKPLMSPGVSDAAIARSKTLFQKYVRPRGPYPALAFGPQPLGVLPVTSLSRWCKVDGTGDPGAMVLSKLRNTWLAAADKAPRLGRSNDLGADLNAVLSQSPMSVRWLARGTQSILTTSFMNFVNLFQFRRAIVTLDDYQRTNELQPLGVDGPAFMLAWIFDDTSYRINLPLVAGPAAARNAALTANYISAVASAAVDALKAHNVNGASDRSLLYLLLRHATLQVMARAAHRFAGGNIEDPVFVSDMTKTVWARLKTPIAALENRTLSEVFAGTLPGHPDLQELAQHRTALTTLSKVPVGDLERLTAEGLDSCSHRFDAWVTALASERLAAMRTAKPLGCHLGAYAWLDAPPLPLVAARDGAAPIPDPDSEGYMHAPGLDHARTAAILRAGYIDRFAEGVQSPLAVDLSSERVRDARSLLEAVRNGATLTALLGDRIERLMVEGGTGPDLSAVREQFPLVDGSGRKRIDGLRAVDAWGKMPRALMNPVQVRMVAVMDAIGDLLLAEAVHQQASGNPGRAQPALAALDTGVTLPSEFSVVRTESNGSASTWRVVLPLAPEAMNTWIAGIIGSTAALAATVSTPGKADQTFTVAQLNIPAAGLLDYVKAGAEATGLSAAFAAKAGGGTVSYSPALQTALQAAYAIGRMLRSSRKLQDGDVGPNRTPLPSLAKKSARRQWLHDLGRVRPSVEALDALDFILRRSGREVPLRFLSVDKDVNVVFVGDPPAGPVTGLLLDGWNERTPATDATTGIAMHYDAPRSRAPQAILVVTPPNPAAWDIDSVESVLLETADLTRMRMVRPADVHGSYLPALYFANNFEGDTVATNFSSTGIIAQYVSA